MTWQHTTLKTHPDCDGRKPSGSGTCADDAHRLRHASNRKPVIIEVGNNGASAPEHHHHLEYELQRRGDARTADDAEPQATPKSVVVTVPVEVTRNVPVTRVVEVTREVQMPVPHPFPVTVEVPVHVTREVEIVRTVEVTRIVEVDRVVTATPAPQPTVTPRPEATATPRPQANAYTYAYTYAACHSNATAQEPLPRRVGARCHQRHTGQHRTDSDEQRLWHRLDIPRRQPRQGMDTHERTRDTECTEHTRLLRRGYRYQGQRIRRLARLAPRLVDNWLL